MNNKKRNFLISGILLLIAITFTILVKVVDVKQIGVNNSSIGFATLNQFIFETTGVNMIWYHITDWLGLIPVFMAIVYAFIGLIQLIKRRSIFKVDKEIILLGLYYIIVIALYVFFEKVIINYRPILMNGFLEASYPSSHTLMTICICGSSILINKKLFNNKITKVINYLSIIIITITVVGRLISGVHWFTDIIGGILISSGLLMTFYSLLSIINKENY
ncbi:MAG: phosphatase PAP2 family protein [Clostridium sp.]|nr:phosphatase PAP2 family protein [Clostridium sp.]MCI6458146.1 phosphatase PAP2 family protein [Clostridium sp.]MCI7559075.1 phosphatase PAP2 family protein [Clostridium sp.]MDY4236447.1 phosphatase PAP2 family protein [Bacilli bacterium]MDY4544628.1 phosphatase PAP2 family protein [Bacilli bacterium]